MKLVIVLLIILSFDYFGWKTSNSYPKETNQEQIHCGWRNCDRKEQKRGMTKDQDRNHKAFKKVAEEKQEDILSHTQVDK